MSPYFADAVQLSSSESFEELETIWPKMDDFELNKISKILVALGHIEVAFSIVKDLTLKFDYAVRLTRLDDAFEIASEIDNAEKW